MRAVTVNDVLDGHVALDIECLDRIYLNAYVPTLQTSAQVAAFLTRHLGFPFPSPALFKQLGDRFRRSVRAFADTGDIPWVTFDKHDNKLEVMRPHLARQAATGRSGVAAVGVAQEFQRVWTAYQRQTQTGAAQFSFTKADRRVTCYYFYLWDADFGPAFVKVCAYFPYPAKIWLNGHEWVKRQATGAGIGFAELSNGFAACDDPAALQAICDRLGPGHLNVFTQRWLSLLPLPFGQTDRDAGYWWECSMRQIEISRTLVFDAPRHARGFFEALIADNLDIGRPGNVEIIFGRQIRSTTKGVFRTAIDRHDNKGVVVNVFYKHSRIEHPTVDTAGRRTPALRFGDPRVMALVGALCTTLLAATGFTNKSLRALVGGLLGTSYSHGQMTYDLRRLRLNGLIRRIEHANRYVLTPEGIRVAVFYTKLYNRLLVPLIAADQPQAPPELRAALQTITRHVDAYVDRARLPQAA